MTITVKVIIDGKEYTMEEAKAIYNALKNIIEPIAIVYPITYPVYPNTWPQIIYKTECSS